MSVDLMELQDSARQVLGGETVSVPEDATWAQVAELGWLMVAVPEELGGLGMNAQGPVVLQTELGRKLSGAPYLSGVLAIEAFCGSTHAERESWVERLMGGEFVAAPLADGSLAIEQTDHGFTVRGTATAVQSADKAEQLLVWDVQSRCVALLALNQDGVTVTPRESWDETRRLFDVALDSVALQADSILASGDAAATLARRLATLRDFGLAADAVGAADMLLLYRRVIFGAITRENVRRMLDLSWREKLVFAPLIALALIFGIYPMPVLDVMSASVENLIDNYQLALGEQAAPNLLAQLIPQRWGGAL